MVTDPTFDGDTFVHEEDFDRLKRQLDQVRTFMLANHWRTLSEIGDATGFPEASISARLRDLRKKKFGGWVVERRARGYRAKGLFEYLLREYDADKDDPKNDKKEKKQGGKGYRKPATAILFEGTKEIHALIQFAESKGRTVTKKARKVLDYLYSEAGI